VSPWTEWSNQDPSGKRIRIRTVIRPALNGGAQCPDLMEEKYG